LSVAEGSSVHILEEDDGSGWIKVADQKGAKGLIPASYVAVGDGDAHVSSGNPEGSGQFARGLYAYTAGGSDELDIIPGALVELSHLGQNYGDGWWEGFDGKGKKGIFPSNYVELV